MVPASRISSQEIADKLAAGAVIVLPTETVYGLAVRPDRPAAIERVFELKGRPQTMNLPVIIGAVGQLETLGVDYDPAARRLTHRFWPGPLTIVMGFDPRSPRPAWLEGRAEVAIRLPGHELLRQVALAAGPILVTSANSHGAGPQREAAEAVRSLLGSADLVVDGGTLTPTPSTIVNTRLSPPKIERLGAISATEISDALGETLAETR